MSKNQLNIIPPYYLYNIQTQLKNVKGILCKANLTLANIDCIIPHENTDQHKVSNITDSMLSGKYNDELPIIIGVTEDQFCEALKQYNLNHLNMILDQKNITIINSIVSGSTKLILIDGHHRLAAAKQILKFKQNLSLWLWIVPFNDFEIGSFIKTFSMYNDVDINELINLKYKYFPQIQEINKKNILNITLGYKNGFYQLCTDNECEFLDEMENIKNKFVKNKLFLLEKQEIQSDSSGYVSLLQSKCISLNHSTITHQMVLNIVKNKKLLPLHATCFKPKPLCVPGSILYMNDDNFVMQGS